ncbi:DUF2326 domain-containing protein [Gammaproteobacteria bacterium]|nr:DUF2326 domain-containing protein [Gammaproteobacteria bacterium]
MLKVHKLYSEPELFDPIEFLDGINLILGETDNSSKKTNGVGKSLSIEFLNYCLLKDFTDNRIARIPHDAFSHDALICLDFSIHGKFITSKRSIRKHESPLLVIEGKTTEYFNIEDAKNQLTNILFGSAINDEHPSFRSVLDILIRDERSEFKSIIKCHNTERKIPSDYTAHLYLLGINPFSYKEAKKLQKDIDDTTTARRKLKLDVQNLTGKKFKDATLDLNELTGQVEQIKAEMDTLENAESFEIVRDEIIQLETEMNDENIRAGAIKAELSKIELFKGDNYIDDAEVADIYERFTQGLGSMIKREIHEVTAFKKKIDDFKSTLIESHRGSLLHKLKKINESIKSLDKRYKNKLSVIDKAGVLKNLKMTVSVYQHKLEEQSQLSSFIKKYNEYDQHIKLTKHERDGKITILDSLVSESESIKVAFEKTILEIHNHVMGNKRCSFNIEINDKKEIVNYELRIHDDGSHSNEREKVFFYDIAMLLTNEIAEYHPGLLVHDNIFDVDQDTLIKSLEYLAKNEDVINKKQYILTLNSDKLHSEEKQALSMNLEMYKRAAFTKSDGFLKKHYQEK